jgi:hypothetical protein
MKDSTWICIKDTMLLSVLFVIEVGLIPFHELNKAYERTKKKMNTE